MGSRRYWHRWDMAPAPQGHSGRGWRFRTGSVHCEHEEVAGSARAGAGRGFRGEPSMHPGEREPLIPTACPSPRQLPGAPSKRQMLKDLVQLGHSSFPHKLTRVPLSAPCHFPVRSLVPRRSAAPSCRPQGTWFISSHTAAFLRSCSQRSRLSAFALDRDLEPVALHGVQQPREEPGLGQGEAWVGYPKQSCDCRNSL